MLRVISKTVEPSLQVFKMNTGEIQGRFDQPGAITLLAGLAALVRGLKEGLEPCRASSPWQ